MSDFKIGDTVIHKKQSKYTDCVGCILRITHISKMFLHGFIIKFPKKHTCGNLRKCYMSKNCVELSYEHCLYYKMKVRRDE